MEITLGSGKKVTYEKPGWVKRGEIWDEAILNRKQSDPLTVKTATKIVLDCKVATEKELDEDKFTIAEVYEIAGKLLGEIYQTELTKKK